MRPGETVTNVPIAVGVAVRAGAAPAAGLR